MSFNGNRARLIATLRRYDKINSSTGVARKLVEVQSEIEQAFIFSIDEASLGRPEALAAILRSTVDLTPEFRNWLAVYVEGSMPRPAHRQKSLVPSKAQRVAERAHAKKDELKKAGEKYRIVSKAIQQAIDEAKADGISVGYDQV